MLSESLDAITGSVGSAVQALIPQRAESIRSSACNQMVCLKHGCPRTEITLFKAKRRRRRGLGDSVLFSSIFVATKAYIQ